MLVGNQSDLERQVTTEEGRQFADQRGMIFFETSARTGSNVEQMLAAVAEQLVSRAIARG